MMEIDILWGSSIKEAATDAIELANKNNKIVSFNFNGIKIQALPNQSTADELVNEYLNGHDREVEAYSKTPEAKKKAREEKARTEKLQKIMNEAIKEMPKLDFSNLETLIGWICKIQEASNHTEVETPTPEILCCFSKNGYLPNVNLDNEFNGEDKENFARYLIGQALDTLGKVGAIHHIIHKFARQWREKHGEKRL